MKFDRGSASPGEQDLSIETTHNYYRRRIWKIVYNPQ
jgi:hypothetical protein